MFLLIASFTDSCMLDLFSCLILCFFCLLFCLCFLINLFALFFCLLSCFLDWLFAYCFFCLSHCLLLWFLTFTSLFNSLFLWFLCFVHWSFFSYFTTCFFLLDIVSVFTYSHPNSCLAIVFQSYYRSALRNFKSLLFIFSNLLQLALLLFVVKKAFFLKSNCS